VTPIVAINLRLSEIEFADVKVRLGVTKLNLEMQLKSGGSTTKAAGTGSCRGRSHVPAGLKNEF